MPCTCWAILPGFLKRSCLAQPDWRAKRVHDRFICKHGRRLFRNHSPWLVLDCSTPLMAIFNRAYSYFIVTILMYILCWKIRKYIYLSPYSKNIKHFYLFHYDKLDTNIRDFEAKLPSSPTETLNTNPSQSIKSENVHHLYACLHQ